jgi:hypothetical protein
MDWVQIGVVAAVLVTLTTLVLNSLGILGKLAFFFGIIWKRIAGQSADRVPSGPAIPRHTIVVIQQPRLNALWWSMGSAGEKPILQVVGDFNVTNTWSKDIRLAGALLRYKRWVLLPQIVRGDSSVKDLKSVYSGNYPVPPNAMTWLRVSFHFPHMLREPGKDLVADIAVIDQFNNLHWLRGLRFKHPNAMLS